MTNEMQIYYNTDDNESMFGSDDLDGVNVEASIAKLISLLEEELGKAFPEYTIDIFEESKLEMVYTDDDDDGYEIRPWVEAKITDIWSDLEKWVVEE